MIVKLGDIARECKCTTGKKDCPIVGLEHLEPKELLLKNYSSDPNTTFTKSFKAGQILFGRRRSYQQKASVATFDGICSGDIIVIEAIPEKVEPRLLPFIIQNEAFFNYSIIGSAGGLSPRVKWQHLANYEFELPSLEEQRVLADKLWAAYEVKESYKNLLAQTDKLLHAQFEKMFGEDDKNGTIASLVRNNIASVKKTYKSDDLISYIDISSIDAESNEVVSTTDYVVCNAPSRAQQCVQKGDILVSTTRPINRNIAVVQSEAKNLVASTGFCVLRPKDEHRAYLLSIVKSEDYTKAMCDKSTGGVYPAVNNSDVLSYEIVIPSSKVLHEVTTLVEQAEQTKASLHKGIEAIEAVIRSLIAEGTTKV